jgi:hypothetical protein
MIGLELLGTVKTYITKKTIHVEVVLLVAIIAIARKVVILEPKALDGRICLASPRSSSRYRLATTSSGWAREEHQCLMTSRRADDGFLRAASWLGFNPKHFEDSPSSEILLPTITSNHPWFATALCRRCGG